MLLHDPMLETAKGCMAVLEIIPRSKWAEYFVELYLGFYRKFGRGVLISTTHGVDFFHNVVECCEGRMKWKEEGEYGENFRKLIATRPKHESKQPAPVKTAHEQR